MESPAPEEVGVEKVVSALLSRWSTDCPRAAEATKRRKLNRNVQSTQCTRARLASLARLLYPSLVEDALSSSDYPKIKQWKVASSLNCVQATRQFVEDIQCLGFHATLVDAITDNTVAESELKYLEEWRAFHNRHYPEKYHAGMHQAPTTRTLFRGCWTALEAYQDPDEKRDIS